MVDGGLDYPRYGGDHMELVESIVVTDNEPFTKVRQYMYRLGPSRNDKIKRYVIRRLFEMTDNHLNALIIYPDVPNWQLKLVKKEIAYRKKKGIIIPD